jgi:serine/threonine protein phosphatase PrpC
LLGRPSPAARAEPELAATGTAGRAGWRADGASSDWCTVRAASVVGARHRLAGQASDDSYAWALTDGRLIVAVADGVGSVAGAGAAAARAAESAVTAPAGEAVELTAAGSATGVGPAADVLQMAIAAANRAIVEGATTLVVAVVERDGHVALARVGDSTAFVVADDAAVELFPAPDPDRADTATAALPAEDPEPEMAGTELVAGAALILVTDGVAEPWRDGPTTVAPALIEGLRRPAPPIQLLALADFERQGCHDDRTLVAVWPKERLLA